MANVAGNRGPAGDLIARVRAATAHGAEAVDLGAASTTMIAAVRAAEPYVIVCADGDGADLTRHPAVAQRTGAALLRAPAEGTEGAAPGETEAARTVLTAAPPEVARLAAEGWRVLVDVDAAEPAATIAVAAVCLWLGASIVRTRRVSSIRQAADMVESIRGTRAPYWTRRGLA